MIIIGAGQAGAQCAFSLRQLGFDGRITLIGDEPELPYQRPPLSKAYLLGKLDKARLPIRPASYYAERNIDLRLGVRVTAIRRVEQQVVLDSGEVLDFDRLLLATGGGARGLNVPGGELRSVHVLRTMADVDHLRGSCAPASAHC